MTLEDDLRSALHQHADQVEPSANGLERIQARLAPVPVQRPRLAPRLLAAAAILVAIGAVGAMTFRSSGEGDIDLAASSSTTDPAAAAVVNELPPLEEADDSSSTDAASSTLGEGTPDEGPNIPLAPAGTLGPRANSPEAAVVAFLGLIQRGDEEVTIEIQDDLARLSRISEGGDMVDVTTLQLGSVEMDGAIGYVVMQAISPRVVIESPSSLSTSSGSTLTVSGQGEGFEADVGVHLYSSRDGVWLNRSSAKAGNFGVVAPYSADLSVSGSGPAWVVVQSSGGTDTKLEPFSAVPVVIDAPVQAPEYLVTNIPVDDPDGGLVVRSLPGTDGDELVILPAGQGGVYQRSALSAFIGDGEPTYGLGSVSDGQQEWWNIWLPEPLEDGRQWGWVNINYLAELVPEVVVEVDADAQALESIGSQFVLGLRGDDAAFAGLPWNADGVTVGLTNDVRTMSAATLGSSFWSNTATWTLPEAFGGTIDTTGRELLSPTQELLGSTVVDLRTGSDTTTASPYGNDQALFASQFPGASYVQVFDPTRDSGWMLINIFVNEGPDGPVIVGVVATPWTP